MSQKLLFCTQSYQYLKNEMLASGDFEAGEVEVRHFPDGERYQRLCSEVSGRNVVLVGGTPDDSATLELYDLACAIEQYGARSLTIIIPYFGYSTMERAVKTGEVVTAKTRARLLSSIPRTGSHNHFILLDLHTEGLPYYFEGESRSTHLYCKEIVIQAARKVGGEGFVMACTDAGRAKWVESLANDMAVPAAFVFKRRLSGDKTEITGVSADVAGKTVIIYDDMIRTGGSLIQAAKAYQNAGAKALYAITTHGLFNQNALERLQGAQVFEKIISTNTHPNAHKLQSDFLEIHSVAPLLVAKLKTL